MLARAWLITLVMLAGAAQAQQPPDGLALSLNCSTCHGLDGKGVTTVAPLKGMTAAVIAQSLKQFKAGERPATIMTRIAKGFSDAEIQAIAQHLASQK